MAAKTEKKTATKEAEKKPKINPLYVALGLGGAFFALTAAKKAPEVVTDARRKLDIQFQRAKVQYKILQPTKLTLGLYYKIRNGNPVGMDNIEFQGEAYIKNVFLGNIDSTAPFNIPASTTTPEIKLELKINLEQLAKDIQEKENVSPDLEELARLIKAVKAAKGFGDNAKAILAVADQLNQIFKKSKSIRDVDVVGVVITDLGDIDVSEKVRIV